MARWTPNYDFPRFKSGYKLDLPNNKSCTLNFHVLELEIGLPRSNFIYFLKSFFSVCKNFIRNQTKKRARTDHRFDHWPEIDDQSGLVRDFQFFRAVPIRSEVWNILQVLTQFCLRFHFLLVLAWFGSRFLPTGSDPWIRSPDLRQAEFFFQFVGQLEYFMFKYHKVSSIFWRIWLPSSLFLLKYF